MSSQASEIHSSRFNKIAVVYFIVYLIIPIAIGWYIFFIHPNYMLGNERLNRMLTFSMYAINFVLFPVIARLLLRGLNFMQHFFELSRRENLIYNIIFTILLFWCYYIFKNQLPNIPILAILFLSVFITTIVSTFFNGLYHVNHSFQFLLTIVVVFYSFALSGEEYIILPLCCLIVFVGVVVFLLQDKYALSLKSFFISLIVSYFSVAFSQFWFYSLTNR